jgi:phosphopantothenoylcysteine decarboxylase
METHAHVPSATGHRKCVVLGVTGSIAAFKAADLASQLVKLDCEVHVVMTAEATRFITPLTLQTLSRQPVVTDLFDEKIGWQPGHIELADRADLLLIAPATAQIIAELAHGFANHALTAIALATRAPVLLAPAMNGKMWLHPATLANVECLRARGAQFIGPEEGLLACGYEGVGRLWPVDGILAAARALLREAREERPAAANTAEQDA